MENQNRDVMNEEVGVDEASVSSAASSDSIADTIPKLSYVEYKKAVLNYNRIIAKKKKSDDAFQAMSNTVESHNRELNDINEQISRNRSEWKRIHDEAVGRLEKDWQDEQDAISQRIDRKINEVKKEAEKEDSARWYDFFEREDVYKKHKKKISGRKKYLENEKDELEKRRDMYNNIQVEDIPVEDKHALKILERSREKGWLTPYYKALLSMDAKEVCKKRIKDVENVKKRERDLSNSDFIQEVVEGEVTSKVFGEFSIVASIAFFLITYACMVCSIFISPMSLAVYFFEILRAFLSSMLFGGLLTKIGEVIGKRLWFDDEMSSQDRSVLIAFFVVGAIGGIFFWRGWLFGKAGTFVNIYSLISSVGAAFFFGKFLRFDLCEKLLGKLPFLKNRTRYYLFKDVEGTEKDLQIYCYLSHDAVIQHLTMVKCNEVVRECNEKLALNKKLMKQNALDEKKLEAEKAELDEFERIVIDLNRKTDRELTEKIREIKKERVETEKPDFETLIPEKELEELKNLDDEYNDLTKSKEEKELLVRTSEEELSSLREMNEKIGKLISQIDEAMRTWNSSPIPSEADFKLQPVMSFDNKKDVVIIEHGLKSLEIQYSSKGENIPPIESLKSVIYRYIKGLLKINPEKMFQVNIIDPVSSPSILLNSERFKFLVPGGIVNGVHSVDEFEIRLFGKKRDLKIFNIIFGQQGREIRNFMLRHGEEGISAEDYDIETANQIKHDNENPFKYQVMFFIVPRAYDDTSFFPPKYIVDMIKNKNYFQKGILPIFFTDIESIHPDWKKIIGICELSLVIGGSGK